MHNKQNNKESKTYVQGLRPFVNTLPRSVKGILKKNGYNYSEIINKWNSLVGKDISDFAYPRSIKMKNGNSNGTLVLSVKRGNEISIEYSKKEIIDKINSFFGYNLINEVRIYSYNSNFKIKKNMKNFEKFNKNFEDKIDKVRNTDIRDSLSQLLKTIKNDKI